MLPTDWSLLSFCFASLSHLKNPYQFADVNAMATQTTTRYPKLNLMTATTARKAHTTGVR